MLKSNVSWSINKDSFLQGKESAKKAVVDLMETKVAFVYTSVDSDVEKVLEGAKTVLGTAPIIGCTSSAGIIVPDGFITGPDGYTGILALGDPDLKVGVAASKKEGTARETGKKVAEEAMAKLGEHCSPAYFYMAASPGEEEDYMKGIEDVVGNIPVFGGSAADNTIEGKWKIYDNNSVFGEGVAIALFCTEKEMVNVYTGEYAETDNVGIITKLDGKRKLVEIDGVPALEKYAEWTGEKVKDLEGGNLLVKTITKPLGVKNMLGDLVAIRHPMNGNKDKTMNVGNDLAEHTAIIQMEGTIDGLIEAAEKTMKEVNTEMDSDVGAYLLVHCGGRRLGISERVDEVVEKIRNEAKGVPFMTIFTFGEYGVTDHSANTAGGLMLSFTAFAK